MNAIESVRDTCWPALDDIQEARSAARLAAWFLVLISVGKVITVVTIQNTGSVMNNFSFDIAWVYVDALAFIFLAIFFFRLSRTATVLALALWLLEGINRLPTELASHHNLGDMVSTSLFEIMVALILVNGVRGTLSWRRFEDSEIPEFSEPD